MLQTSYAEMGDSGNNLSGTILLRKSEVEFTSYIGKVLPEYVRKKIGVLLMRL